MTCTAAAPCAGRLLLENAPLPGTHAAAARKHRKAKAPGTVTYGSASFMLASGTNKTLSVALSKAGRALFSKGHRTAGVWADVQLTGGGAPTSSRITLRR